jgi:hypothetical protein
VFYILLLLQRGVFFTYVASYTLRYSTLEVYCSCKVCTCCLYDVGQQKSIAVTDILTEGVTAFSVDNFTNYTVFS